MRVEVWVPSGQWVALPSLAPGEIGSLSDTDADGQRQVYVFSCAFDDSASGVTRSAGGFDVEDGRLRVVAPLAGMEELAYLHDGESWELAGGTKRVRFTHLRGADAAKATDEGKAAADAAKAVDDWRIFDDQARDGGRAP